MISITTKGIQSVLVYGGHHVAGGGLKGLYHLSSEKDTKMIQLIAAHMKRSWDIRTFYGENLKREFSSVSLTNTLIVIPPGASKDLDNTFSLEDTKTLSEAVHLGAKLLATCGSAYWIARDMLWNPSPDTTIEKKGMIEAFPVKAVGPLFPQLGQPAGMDFEFKAVTIKMNGQSVVALSGGGGSFFYTPQDGIETLAHYVPYTFRGRSNPIQSEHAALLCHYGEGAALLSMVHFDVGGEDAKSLREVIGCFRDRIDDIETLCTELSPEKERLSALSYLIERLEKS